jgi:hypothetical protein
MMDCRKMDSCFQGDERPIDSNGSVRWRCLVPLTHDQIPKAVLDNRPPFHTEKHPTNGHKGRKDARSVTREHVTNLTHAVSAAPSQYVLRLLYLSKKNFHFESMVHIQNAWVP